MVHLDTPIGIHFKIVFKIRFRRPFQVEIFNLAKLGEVRNKVQNAFFEMIQVNIHSLAETPDPAEEWTSYFNLNDFENEHRDQETQKTRSKARL